MTKELELAIALESVTRAKALGDSKTLRKAVAVAREQGATFQDLKKAAFRVGRPPKDPRLN